MYKFFVIMAVLAIGYAKEIEKAHLTPEQTTKLLGTAMSCLGESGVNPDAIIQIRSGKFSDDEKFHKFIYCITRKIGIASKDGHLKVDKALAKYPNNVNKQGIKMAMEECNKESGSTPEQTAFKVSKCFHAKTPVHLAL